MVRRYQRKSHRQSWSDEQMQLAINSVKEGQTIQYSASLHGVPRSTLQLKLNELSEGKISEGAYKKGLGFKKIFTDSQEIALYEYVVSMENKLLGCTSQDLRRLAYNFAVNLGIQHNFNDETKMAGKDWVQNFMQRHALSCRKAQPTSRARAFGFNEVNVAKFYNILEELMAKHNFQPEDIYNVDESGFSINPKSAARVVAKKGKKQVGGMTPLERGQTVTAELCMSASGKFMPPMLIFPRVNKNKSTKYEDGAPAGAWAEYNKNGWITEEIFIRWFQKFIEFSKPSKDKPVLLLLDGHASHIRSLKIIELANENNVVILCFPPHCTHRLQPLDVGFMKPLSQRYSEIVHKYQEKNKMTLTVMFRLFGQAFSLAAKKETAENSFKKTGIYPFNRSVFSKSDFATTQEDQENIPNNTTDSTQVQKYLNLIRNIEGAQSSNLEDLPKDPVPENACQPLQIQLHDEVKIPTQFLVQAKPLLETLTNSLATLMNSSLVNTPSLACASQTTSTSNMESNDLEKRNIADSNFENSTNIMQSILQPMSASSIANTSPESTSANKTLVSRKSRAGKTAEVTSEEYKAELIAQKIRTMKKEPQEKKVNKKPKIISNISIDESNSLEGIVKKRKVPGPRKPSKKVNVTNTDSRPIIHINSVPEQNFCPQQEIIYEMPTANGNNAPFIFQTLGNSSEIHPVNNDFHLNLDNLQFEIVEVPNNILHSIDYQCQ